MGGWHQFGENFTKVYRSRERRVTEQFEESEELLAKGIITLREFRHIARATAAILVEIVRDEVKAKKARP